ncbi:protein of unknown function [Lachnospiraceae bacterium]|nr:protein of unknown function [Lachnospiraceae bacterium]
MKGHSEKMLYPKELLKLLKDLIETDSLEFVRDALDDTCIRIPYMMSDAVENYIELRGCSVFGVLEEEFEVGTSIRISSDGYMLRIFFCAPDERELRIECSSAIQRITLYQYHRTGHYWVEGNEFLRRLVYMVGTVHDKVEFMGRDYCNETELSYYHLIEFAPFRYWSPIDETMDDWYHNSAAGTEVMRELAREAGDERFLWMIDQYTESPEIRNVLARYLSGNDGDRMMECLQKRIVKGSSSYEERRYDPLLEEQILRKREEITDRLTASGYEGTYPEFQRGNIRVLVIEEQPFTIMDREDAEYRFHFEFCEEADGKMIRTVKHENL